MPITRAAVLALLTMCCLPAETKVLKFSPETLAWGYYAASAPPVMRIQPGDTVEIQTCSGTATRLEALGVPHDQICPALFEIPTKVTNKGPGGHLLTGPLYIEGAEPGDVLEVQIKAIRLDDSFALNSFRPGAGFLPDDFPYARNKVIPLDRQHMMAKFAPGIEIPLHPFFGSMGVAPPEANGRINSAPPWIHAGNMDNKELVAGATLYIPIHVKGALFEVGDGHAGQGDGEVDITAMETSLTGTFRFVVRKDMKLRWPRGETSTHFITMGFHEDLTEATKLCVRETLDFLINEKHLSRDDAYMLTSVGIDLRITQLVDGNKGVHAMIPKAIFH
jgi:acetamidase/formamidase